MSYPHQLRLIFDGHAVGDVLVDHRLPGKFSGRFVPDTDFERHRHLFDEAVKWAQRIGESREGDPGVYEAVRYYFEAIQRLTSKVALPQAPFDIEEFAIDHRFGVEVTFAKATA